MNDIMKFLKKKLPMYKSPSQKREESLLKLKKEIDDPIEYMNEHFKGAVEIVSYKLTDEELKENIYVFLNDNKDFLNKLLSKETSHDERKDMLSKFSKKTGATYDISKTTMKSFEMDDKILLTDDPSHPIFDFKRDVDQIKSQLSRRTKENDINYDLPNIDVPKNRNNKSPRQ